MHPWGLRCAIVVVCLGVPALSVRGFQKSAQAELPDFDRRLNEIPARDPFHGTVAAARLRQKVPTVRIELDPLFAKPKAVFARDGFLSGPRGEGRGVSPQSATKFAADDPYRATKAFLHEHAGMFGHGPEALAQARVTHEFTGAHNGLKTVMWQQYVDDIPVLGALLRSHTTRDGELAGISSGFIAEVEQAATRGSGKAAGERMVPRIAASEALRLAAKNLDETIAIDSVIAIDGEAGPEKRQRFKAARWSDTHTKLIWLPMSSTSLRLCWDVLLTSLNRGEMFRLLIDSETGEVLVRNCLTDYLTDATYRVFTNDSPTPFSPGYSSPSNRQPPLVARSLVTLSALNTNASPNGWINDGDNETRGNNVDAHLDRNGDDQPDLPRPQGSPNRVFDFPIDFTQMPVSYSNAAVVQLFYWCNWMHDQLYDLGFTEAAGNFQTTNFGRGGLGNDAVQADSQDGSGTNNANFSTPWDGMAGRVQMFYWNSPEPDRDGDLDAQVILHEYSHGLTRRSVLGAIDTPVSFFRGLGEGWSDFYALALLSKETDDPDGVYPMGSYSGHLLGGATESYYFGIRTYPYSTDMRKNPLTFKDFDPAQWSPYSGVPRNPRTEFGCCATDPHRWGEIWCLALWEVRANLIHKHGFAAGNRLALQLVTDGLHLTPGWHNFLDARDAILLADQVDTHGANYREIWAGFAKRGLGLSAEMGKNPALPFKLIREAFDVPDELGVNPAGSMTLRGAAGSFRPDAVDFELHNTGTNGLAWKVTQFGGWLVIPNKAGVLGPGEFATVRASPAEAARIFPPGLYTNVLSFVDETSGRSGTREIILQTGSRDYFTTEFAYAPDNSSLDFAAWDDFEFESFTFVPDGSANFYSVCRTPATSFPTDPHGGLFVHPSVGMPFRGTLTGNHQVSLFGLRTNRVDVHSRGVLTFGATDGGTPNVASFFQDMRLAVFNSAAGFEVTPEVAHVGAFIWQELNDRLAVTYSNVSSALTPETVNHNNFQVELFYDGVVRFTYLHMDERRGLVGLSPGGGMPPDFVESDYSSYPTCEPFFNLNVSPTATEGAGVLNNAGRITFRTPAPTNLTVDILASDPSKVIVPAQVLVSANETNAAFSLNILDNADLDGTQPITISASAPGFHERFATILVFDNESAVLGLSLPTNLVEGASAQAQISVSAPVSRDVFVMLSCNDPAALRTPSVAIIPAGQTSAVFSIAALNNNVFTTPKSVLVTAHVENWNDASGTITVSDDEPRVLAVSAPQEVSEAAGTFSGGRIRIPGLPTANFDIALSSSDSNRLAVPPVVTLNIGNDTAYFDVTLKDNGMAEGVQSVTITAQAPGWQTAQVTILIYDDELPPLPTPVTPQPASGATNVSLQPTLSWQTQTAGPFTNPPPVVFDLYFGTNSNPDAAELVGSTSNMSWSLPSLEVGTTYFWKIVGRNGARQSTGPVWQFTTRDSRPVDHFEWAPMASTQAVWEPFPVALTARDDRNHTVTNFSETVFLAGGSGPGAPPRSILITEVDCGPLDLIEFANACGAPLNAGKWSVTLYDNARWPAPSLTFIFPDDMLVRPGEFFYLIDGGRFPGSYPFFSTGTNINWSNATTNNPVAVLLRDASGQAVDFFCALQAVPGQITDPIPIFSQQWSGDPVSAAPTLPLSYQRYQNVDYNSTGDWLAANPTPNAMHPLLTNAFSGAYTSVLFSPTLAAPFIDGKWSGSVLVTQFPPNITFFAYDASGHLGTSAPVTLIVPDSDHDGIPDYWERQHGLNPTNAADAALDTDGDGMSNLQEYLAGTDLYDAGSVFRITALVLEPTRVRVSFLTVAGKRYRLEGAFSASGPWVPRLDNIAGTGGAVEVNVLKTTRPFYRVRLLP